MKLRAAAIQQKCNFNQQAAWDYSASAVAAAAAGGAELVVLPELHSGPYFCQREDDVFFDFALPVPGPGTEYFSEVAQKAEVVLVTSFFERASLGDDDVFFNTSVVFEKDGSIAGTYRKSHIPYDPGFHEKYYFQDGDSGIEPINTSVGILGVLVCWDQWFPEAARTMAAKGAEVLIYPTAIGAIPEDPENEKQVYKEGWVTIQRSHSIANALPVISVNRVGVEKDEKGPVGEIRFWGSSFITGVFGDFISKAADEEEIIFADLDLSKTSEMRKIWPFQRDLRPEMYSLPSQ